MYEKFYKFKDKPFALSPDPRFYYGSKEHNRVLAYLRYGLNQGEGFIVVTGDVGTGKTTLVGTLFKEIQEDPNLIATQLVTTQLGPDELLRMVASAFGLPFEGITKTNLLKSLERFFMQKSRENKRVLLVVDEAQNLEPHSLEELRMLSNFQVGPKSLLQSFLLGQAEFRDTLRSPDLEQFRQRVIASYHLGPMGKEETRGYIEHRLSVVGWKNDPEFTDSAYTDIFSHSDGVPRRINTLCDRLLLFAYLEELHKIDESVVASVVKELDEEIHYMRDDKGSSTQSVSRLGRHNKSGAIADDLSVKLNELEVRIEDIERVINKTREWFAAFTAKR